MMQGHGMAARLSKFKVGDLALKSALELERARAGMPYDPKQLSALAAALRASAGEPEEPGKVAHMRPGYLEPFERLSRSSGANPKTSREVREFVVRAVEEIDAAAASKSLNQKLLSKLVDFCLELNREFVRRQPTEGRLGRAQRSVPVEAFIR